jgi:hypothetical protein
MTLHIYSCEEAHDMNAIYSENMLAIIENLNHALECKTTTASALYVKTARDRLLRACVADTEVETFRSIGEIIAPIVERALNPTPELKVAAE